MLEVILGSASAARVLAYIAGEGSGYATAIARAYQADLSPVQKQLERLERGGVLVSERVGRTLLYRFSPDYPLVNELKALVRKDPAYRLNNLSPKLPVREPEPMWPAFSRE